VTFGVVVIYLDPVYVEVKGQGYKS